MHVFRDFPALRTRARMSILDRDIDKLCALAQLGLDASERSAARVDLERMILMVDAIAQVNTRDVAPLAHPLDATQRLRIDATTNGVGREALQGLTRHVEGGLYLVPRVIDA